MARHFHVKLSLWEFFGVLELFLFAVKQAPEFDNCMFWGVYQDQQVTRYRPHAFVEINAHFGLMNTDIL